MSELKLVLNLSAWSVQWVEFHKVYSMNRYFIHDFLDLSKSKKSEWELQLHHFVVLLCFGSALLTKQYIGYNMVSLWISKELSVMVGFRLSDLEIAMCIPFRFRFHVFFSFVFQVAFLVEINSMFLHIRSLLQICGISKFSSAYRVNSLFNFGELKGKQGRIQYYTRQPLSRAIGLDRGSNDQNCYLKFLNYLNLPLFPFK